MKQEKELGLGCLGTQKLTPKRRAYGRLPPRGAQLSGLALLGPELALKPSCEPPLFPACLEGNCCNLQGFPCLSCSLGVSSVRNFSPKCQCWAGPGQSATYSKQKKKVCPDCRHQCLPWPAGEGRGGRWRVERTCLLAVRAGGGAARAPLLGT